MPPVQLADNYSNVNNIYHQPTATTAATMTPRAVSASRAVVRTQQRLQSAAGAAARLACSSPMSTTTGRRMDEKKSG